MEIQNSSENEFHSANEEEVGLELRRRNLALVVSDEIHEGVFTTDNPSPSNELTGLDQVCAYYSEFLECSLSEFKKIVLEVYRGQLASEDVVEDLGEDLEEEWEEEDIPEGDEVDFTSGYRHLALGMILGIVTDDNPSELNGLTGLEQLIAHLRCTFNSEQILEAREAVLKEYARLYLSGGYNIPQGSYGLDLYSELFDQDSSNST